MVAVSELARSRAEARADGKKFYFTGKPCSHGHISIRYARGECVECTKIGAKIWHEANPEKAREKGRAHYARSEKRRSRNRSKEHCERTALYNKNHPEVRRDVMARWRAKNPAKIQQYGQQRYARKKGAGDHFTTEELNALKTRVGKKCWGCGNRCKLTIDHIKALCRDGSGSIRNIQFLCRSCNSSKRDRSNEDFARSRGLLL